MRFHITSEFSAVREDYRCAYAKWEEVTEDPNIPDFSPEDKAAGKAESDALDRLLSHSASTPMEISHKLAFMREREAETWTGYREWMAQIERELIELQRPCVSPDMAALFDTWRLAYAQWAADVDVDANGEAHSAAYLALMKAPCFTPGDFVIKVYMNQLGEHGSTIHRPGGFLFELDESDLRGGLGVHDGASEAAFARDIRECDLGRCLLAFGRVDFDAEAWLAAADRAEMDVHVVIQEDGSRWLFTSELDRPADERRAERFRQCQALLAGGLGIIAKERCAAVIDAIVERHPALVMDVRTQAEVAA